MPSPSDTGTGALLIIGGTGELGRATVAAASTGWDGAVYATYKSAPASVELRSTCERCEWLHLDTREHKAVRSLLACSRRIVSVIYCAVPKHNGANQKAGDTDIRAGIVDDVVSCAEAAAMCGAKFVAVSTDLVFDGNLPAGEKYTVTSEVSPTNSYGKYKAEMERQLANISGNIIIARSSLILTLPDGRAVKFVKDAIEGKHGKIELFSDELRNMSFSDDLGAALVELAGNTVQHRGIVHIVAGETTNRWELAKKLAAKYGMEDLLAKKETAIEGLSKDSGLNRPLNCALDDTLTKKILKTKIRGVTERLSQ